MLEVRNLASGYQKIPIILGVNFEVAAGEFVGILGHNGMGKTTLLKTVVGQLPATAGSIRFAGTEIARAPSHRRARLGLGYVPQGRQIFPGLSVLDNMRMGAASAGLGDDVLDEVLEALPRLKPILGRAGGVLSGGEQQILALARCLAGHPKLILLDEPTEGIQPSIIEEIIEILLRPQEAERPHHRAGRAESRIHPPPVGPRPDHPEGPHHRRGPARPSA